MSGQQKPIVVKGENGCAGNPDCTNSPLPPQWQPGVKVPDKPSDECVVHNPATGPVVKPKGT